MVVFGTRPEAIKMCPLVNELKRRKSLEVVVCVTGQHRKMLEQVLDAFNVVPDYDLSIMKDNQTLFDVTVNILERIETVLEKVKPDVVLVMRDTTERPEGVEAGTLKIVGTDEQTIFNEFNKLLEDKSEYEKMSKASNPYGDGLASKRIADILVDSK